MLVTHVYDDQGKLVYSRGGTGPDRLPTDDEAEPIDWGLITPPSPHHGDSDSPGWLVSPVDPENLIVIIEHQPNSHWMNWKEWVTNPGEGSEGGGGGGGGNYNRSDFMQPPVNGPSDPAVSPSDPEGPDVGDGIIPPKE